jgi:sugar phosphate isomerase/epimerase
LASITKTPTTNVNVKIREAKERSVPPQEIPFAVFTKPWPNDSIEELADRALELGFDGAEMPVRPGFQVAPENAEGWGAVGLRALLDGLDGRSVGAIWDAAHDALAGVAPESGLDLVWDRLVMVNLKNAFYIRTNGPEAEPGKWGRSGKPGPLPVVGVVWRR